MEKGKQYADNGFVEEDIPISEIDLYKVCLESLMRCSLGRCVEYRKTGDEIYGKKRYFELVDPEIARNLGGGLIYLVGKNKRTCNRNSQR